MFAAEFEPADIASRRRSERASVSLDAELDRGGMGRTLCKVVDISLHGARLSSYSALRRGQSIELTLPQIGQVVADVMWADDFTAGCQFRQPLSQDQLDQLIVD
ncbi:PilZ domain-containing protein [Sphingomonas rubra]|uniref:PilZ domain-containing protein n=1 Tax=Sphingomonas rubra TaxID=634430 RepID=A0A1I5PYU9_9SPHN|nr:PilZ domain-containing protein [Sphingomonas rubra]SFP38851.1 PilZ domain-containing protein [Sphingomonas rubra]